MQRFWYSVLACLLFSHAGHAAQKAELIQGFNVEGGKGLPAKSKRRQICAGLIADIEDPRLEGLEPHARQYYRLLLWGLRGGIFTNQDPWQVPQAPFSVATIEEFESGKLFLRRPDEPVVKPYLEELKRTFLLAAEERGAPRALSAPLQRIGRVAHSAGGDLIRRGIGDTSISPQILLLQELAPQIPILTARLPREFTFVSGLSLSEDKKRIWVESQRVDYPLSVDGIYAFEQTENGWKENQAITPQKRERTVHGFHGRTELEITDERMMVIPGGHYYAAQMYRHSAHSTSNLGDLRWRLNVTPFSRTDESQLIEMPRGPQKDAVLELIAASTDGRYLILDLHYGTFSQMAERLERSGLRAHYQVWDTKEKNVLQDIFIPFGNPELSREENEHEAMLKELKLRTQFRFFGYTGTSFWFQGSRLHVRARDFSSLHDSSMNEVILEKRSGESKTTHFLVPSRPIQVAVSSSGNWIALIDKGGFVSIIRTKDRSVFAKYAAEVGHLQWATKDETLFLVTSQGRITSYDLNGR